MEFLFPKELDLRAEPTRVSTPKPLPPSRVYSTLMDLNT